MRRFREALFQPSRCIGPTTNHLVINVARNYFTALRMTGRFARTSIKCMNSNMLVQLLRRLGSHPFPENILISVRLALLQTTCRGTYQIPDRGLRHSLPECPRKADADSCGAHHALDIEWNVGVASELAALEDAFEIGTARVDPKAPLAIVAIGSLSGPARPSPYGSGPKAVRPARLPSALSGP